MPEPAGALAPWRRVHFVAIGGTGMSAIARVLLDRGIAISGSDVRRSEAAERLERLGARIHSGHSPQHLPACDLVVVSTAVAPDNPEVNAARERGIPVWHRGQMLARLMAERRGIAVAGCHGKTTTTSMIALALAHGGLDPTALIGGEVDDFGGNARTGSGEWLVAEADESDGSFLELHPEVAVVTNVDNDHLDHYGSFDAVVDAFGRFLGGLPADGTAVLCADDPHLAALAPRLGARVVTYGVREPAGWTAAEVRQSGLGTAFLAIREGCGPVRVALRVPGRHNAQNALAAIAAAEIAGVPPARTAEALADFRGARRRFETLGAARGVRVIDDYAHHPREVAATLQAARAAGFRRILCCFQPHRFTRTRSLWAEFGGVFREADEVVITEIYPAGERPLPGVGAKLIFDAVSAAHRGPVHYVADPQEAARHLADRAHRGDAIIAMGAGNVRTVGETALALLRGRAPRRAAGGRGH